MARATRTAPESGRPVSLSGLLAVLVMVAGAAAAQAQDGAGPEARFRQAQELAAAGRTGEALTIWQELVPLLPAAQQPELHRQLGLAYRKFGKLPEAWHHLSRFLELAPAEDGQRTAMGEELAQVAAVLARTHALARLVSEPAGAGCRFSEDSSAPAYQTPLAWWFRPGRHQLLLVLSGYQETRVELAVGETGTEQSASFPLVELRREGELQVKGPEVGAQIFIDGRLVGTVPWQGMVASGPHEVVVGRTGRPAWRGEVSVEAGGSETLRPRLPAGGSLLPAVREAEGGLTLLAPGEEVAAGETRERRLSWWKLALAGGGVAVLAGAATLHSLAYARNEDLINRYPDGTYWHRAPSSYPQLYHDGYQSEVRPLALTAYALYGVGAAAAVTGGILLLVPERRGAAVVGPAVWTQGAGVTGMFLF